MKTYSIQEISAITGLSHPTLRYYEEIGLLPNVLHENNKRIYTEEHRHRLDAILCFKNTDLSIAKMQDFFTYECDLEHNIDNILTLVTEHEASIQDKIASLQNNLEHIRHKVWYYAEIKKAIENHTSWPRWDDY